MFLVEECKMITYLVGNITEIGDTYLILETSGIGYEIFCSSHTFLEATENHKTLKIYIYEHLKEDAHDLYGFKTKEEKEIFKKLISVSGIGPKGGMQVLNLYTAQEVVEIIIAEDSKALSKVSGIGPKTAQRVILELKDSMAKLVLQELPLLQKDKLENKAVKEEAIEALIVLGYSHNEAKKAVEAIFDYQDTSEKLIKKALSLLV